MRQKPVAGIFLIVLAVVLAGCGDAGGDNNEDGNTESYERPEGAQTIISDEKLAELEELGVSIHSGLNPPDISGTYVFDSSEWIIAPRPENEGRRVCNAETTMTVESDGTLSSESRYTNCSGSGSSSGAFLSGENDCFTSYSKGEQVFEDCERTIVSVASACLSDDGMTNFRSAFFDTKHGEENCESLVSEGRLPPVGGIVVVEEIDGLAAKID